MQDSCRGYDRYHMAGEIAIFLGFVVLAFIVNSDIHTSWLFIDDLVEWYYAQGEGLKSYLCDGDPSHFRPVLRVMQWIEVHVIDNHLGLIIPINLCILIATTYIMYAFMRKLSGSRSVAVMLAAAFECSRFSYYSVSQLLGIIESVPLLLGLMQCVLLYAYIHEPEGREHRDRRRYGLWCFAAAALCYVLASFIHERYMVLMPMFFYAILVRYLRVFEADGAWKGGRDETLNGLKVSSDASGSEPASSSVHGIPWLQLVVAMVAAALVQLLRYKALGTLVPAGTAGTTIAETFSVKMIIVNVLQQLTYLFGVNAGPIHLCGVTWRDTALPVKALTVLMDALIMYVLMHFFSGVFKAGRSESDGGVLTEGSMQTDEGIPANESISTGSWRYIADAIFFAGFIIGYIAASSVTIRVEFRWVYASWGMCCILLSYMSGAAMHKKPDMEIFIKAAACMAAVISIVCSLYYRSGFKDVYLFEEQARRESLIGQTYEKYGEDIFHKNIYIIGNFYQLTEFEELHMLAPHQPLGQERCMNIIHVMHPEEVPDPESENTIVLYEDPVDDTYRIYTYEKQKEESAGRVGL